MGATYKLVFAGPVGSGKTTAIQSLSDIDVLSTEASASDAVRLLKKSTTVAMDYGVLKLDNGTRVHLYGTPGQHRFDFMWDILTEDAIGLGMMLRATAPDPVADLKAYIEGFHDFIKKTAMVVGITHAAEGGWEVRQVVSQALLDMGLQACVMDADARERSHVANLVKALIYSVDPTLDALDAAAG